MVESDIELSVGVNLPKSELNKVETALFKHFQKTYIPIQFQKYATRMKAVSGAVPSYQPAPKSRLDNFQRSLTLSEKKSMRMVRGASTSYFPAQRSRIDEPKRSLIDVLTGGKSKRILSWFERKSLLWQERDKKFKLKSLAVLGAISYNLTRVPSILKGVLKILDLGFLLILKPLADLLAMILLPIASLILKIGLWLNQVAGTGMAGMIAAAVLGLILTIIGSLAAISLTSKLIGVAIETLITGSIGKTILALGGSLIGSAVTTAIIGAIAITVIGIGGGLIAAKILEMIVIKPIIVPLGEMITDAIRGMLGIKMPSVSPTQEETLPRFGGGGTGTFTQPKINVNVWIDGKKQDGTYGVRVIP